MKAIGECGIAYPNDLVREDVCEAVVMSSAIVKALGWMAEPSLDHFWIDNVWHDLGSHARCLTYLPDVIVEHVHPARVKDVKNDQTYQESNARIQHDQVAYRHWRGTRMLDDIATVRQAVSDSHAQA
jgi:hypothetical protein